VKVLLSVGSILPASFMWIVAFGIATAIVRAEK
jgi:hypothetical protein